MSDLQSWSIVVFAFNEGGNVEPVVEQAITILPRLSDSYEIVIVDDGSTDGSENYFKEVAKKHDFIRHIRIYENRGIGNALRMGYANARMENICAVPGDGQFDLQEILPFKSIEPDEIILFYRQAKNYSAFRNFLTGFNAWMNASFLGLKVKDVNWIKIYKFDQIQSVDIQLDSSLLESELCAKLVSAGFKTTEVPSVYQKRNYGKPKGASLQTVTQAIRELPHLIRTVRKFKRK